MMRCANKMICHGLYFKYLYATVVDDGRQGKDYQHDQQHGNVKRNQAQKQWKKQKLQECLPGMK